MTMNKQELISDVEQKCREIISIEIDLEDLEDPKEVKVLQEKLKKAKEELMYANQKLADFYNKKPALRETYFYLDAFNKVRQKCWDDDDSDNELYRTYNCFTTEKEAQIKAEDILIHRTLENIACRLNDESGIDWNNWRQDKCYILLNTDEDVVLDDATSTDPQQGTIYCTSERFHELAEYEIGEERLKSYLCRGCGYEQN